MTHRLAIIGAAGHAHLVIDELHCYPQVQLAAYAPSYQGEDVSRYRGLDLDGPEPRCYDTWQYLLQRERPDIAVVCGRYDLVGQIAIQAAKQGSHIISEKPAAQSLEELAQLRQLVSDHCLVYTCMLAMRYAPAFFTARQVVRQGVIGRPYLISAQKSYRWGSRPQWYTDRRTYGSTINWVGIHAFDYARWIAGIEYVEVYAQHANRVHRDYPGCQDVATVIARLDNGGSAVFHLDYLRPDAALTHGDDRLRVAGSKGVLELVDEGKRLRVVTDNEKVDDWPLAHPGRSLLGDFVLALEGQGELLVPPADAFDITEFAIKATHSADTGLIVAC